MHLAGVITAFIAFAAVFLSKLDNTFYRDTLDFEYKRYGDKSKETVVIIPGLDGATAFFQDVIPELSPFFHVVVYNIPLLTRDRKERQLEYSFNYFADKLHFILDELQIENVHVVGESFGGVIAQRFAIMYPDQTKKVVVLSSLARTELPPEIQFKLDYFLPMIENFGKFYPTIGQFLFALIHVFDVVEPQEPRYVKELFVKEAAFAHFFSVMARIRMVSKLNIVEEVKSIAAPTLIVYGADDHFTLPSSLELHRLIRNSEIASLPGGHLCHVTSPKPFADLIIDFVRK